MEVFIGELKSAPLAKGYDAVFCPGEMEARNDAKNRKQGLALPQDTRADLQRIARATGPEAKLPL